MSEKYWYVDAILLGVGIGLSVLALMASQG
jgi:hypothetical protein